MPLKASVRRENDAKHKKVVLILAVSPIHDDSILCYEIDLRNVPSDKTGISKNKIIEAIRKLINRKFQLHIASGFKD